MTATDALHAPRRCLVFASCVAISLLVFLVIVPAWGLAQIGGQTGYQEWVPSGGGTGKADPGGGAAGGGGEAAGGGGGALSAGGGAATGGTGGGLLGPGGDTASGVTSGVATVGASGGASRTQQEDSSPSGGQGSVIANRASQPPAGRLSAGQAEEATGTIPFTRDNILLALAVAAAAIGAGFAVNRLSRRTAGT